MSLPEQQIVEAISARLSGNTGAGTRVYSDRLWPLTEEKLPAWRIFALEEQVKVETIHWPVLQEHELMVGLQACAQAVSGIDATLNTLRLQALQCLFDTQGHSTLSLDVQMELRGTGPMQPIETADRQIAQRTVQLSVRYRTHANQPEVIV
jgi:hypothetical protein